MQTQDQHDLKIIFKTSLVTLTINFILAVLKLIAGLFGFSKALISDAIHSLSDVFSTVIVMIGARISKKEADHNHPYGHEKFESVSSMILAIILVFTAIAIMVQGITTLIAYVQGNLVILKPTSFALFAALISIILKEAMFWYTKIYAKKVKSTSMMADAWHHRSDAMSSVGSFIGVGFAMLGYVYFDAIASIVISLIIIKVAIDILIKAVNQVVDRAPDPKVYQEIFAFILKQPGVLGIDLLHVRMHVEKLFVDVEIAVDDTLSLISAHKIAESVHDTIEINFPDVKHCMVHVNPEKKRGLHGKTYS